MQMLHEAPAVIEIKNASYAVEAIDPGFAGVAAVRLTKLVNGESYAVVLDLEGRATCECPDFVCRHADHGTHCKHIKATLAAGLLVAPVSGGSPAAVEAPAPVTPADVKRAAYFNLRIPAPAKVEPAPVGQATIPAGWGSIEAEGEALDPSGDSWETWDDSADLPWNLGPEAEPIETSAPSDLDLTAFASRTTEPTDAPHGMKWVAISPSAWVLRSAFPDRVEYPAPTPAGNEDFLTTDEIVEQREVEAENHRQFYGRLPAKPERFVPSEDDEAIASILFRDDRPGHYFVAGQPCPPLGDRSFPARKKPLPRYTGTGLSDRDVYRRRGACS